MIIAPESEKTDYYFDDDIIINNRGEYMPMHVVRTKRMKDELERQKHWWEKQKVKGNNADRAINSNFMLPVKDDLLEEDDLSLNPPAIKNGFQRDGYSAIGRQKMRGKSKPPLGAI